MLLYENDGINTTKRPKRDVCNTCNNNVKGSSGIVERQNKAKSTRYTVKNRLEKKKIITTRVISAFYHGICRMTESALF